MQTFFHNKSVDLTRLNIDIHFYSSYDEAFHYRCTDRIKMSNKVFVIIIVPLLTILY